MGGAFFQPASSFDGVYAARDDPWSFDTTAQERAKDAASLAALPEPRYGRGFEVGCSVGVLTARLAARCDTLLAVDVSDAALDLARARCAGVDHVRFERMAFPNERPEGDFDLIVLSEIACHGSIADLRGGLDWCSAHLRPGGALLLVHWTPPLRSHSMAGDHVHDEALARTAFRLERAHSERQADYRLDVLVAPGVPER